VKVVDFGLAKAVGGEGGGQKVTRTGLVIGTPEFMSPEQLSGDKLDGRSDIYSLGLVLFNMLTGTLPFPADSVQEAMVKRLTDEPAELIEVRPDLHFPPGLQQTLDTALARSPVDRYQSAAKFAHDLAAVVGLSRSDAGTALPFTLADADDKTELIEPVRARRRKRSRVPMVVGAHWEPRERSSRSVAASGRPAASRPPTQHDRSWLPAQRTRWSLARLWRRRRGVSRSSARQQPPPDRASTSPGHGTCWTICSSS